MERSSHDRTAAPERPHGAEVVQGRDPAGGDDGTPVQANEAFVKTEVRASEQTVTLDGGHFEGGHADVGQLLDDFGGIDTWSAGRPALPDGTTVADVDRHRDLVGTMGRHKPTGEAWFVKRRGADDDPGGSARERGRDRGRSAQAAGHFDPALIPDRRNDGADHRLMRRDPTARPIEVNHVQPADARISEPPCHFDRIVAVGRLAREVALAESDGPAAPEVDRRQDLEGSCLAHLTMLAY